jgi:phage/plasmid-like protein (TIGR03299 family)
MYSVIQNDWLFKLLEPVIDDGACVYETGGSILGGRKVWALAKLPGEHYIAADDRIQDYILVTIAHDGSLPFTAMHTSVRVVCQNTLSMAHSMGSEYPIVRIKHTPGYNANIRIAHKILGLSTKASAQMATFFAEMAARAMNTAELTSFAKFVFPSAREEQNKEVDARIQSLRNKLYSGFDADINNIDPDSRHTAWSAYNAYTDILDHDSPSRKGVDRQNWSWFGPGQDKRLRAMRWLQSLIGYKALPEPESGSSAQLEN